MQEVVLEKLFMRYFNVLWGDFITIPLPGGGQLGISLLVMILIRPGLFYDPEQIHAIPAFFQK